MRRPTWSGAITFGLVNVPVAVYTAATSRDVRFNQLHAEDGGRIQLKRFCTLDGKEVSNDEVVKGYEVTPNRYVVVEADELDSLDPEASRSIEIEEFVDLAEIDPVYFENSYYLVPEKGAARAYSLLLKAMADADKVALGKVIIRNREYLVALRPAGQALSMATLYYPDEVVEQSTLDGLPQGEVVVNKRELTMATQLIESMSSRFDPSKYQDGRRERILELIERKAAGEDIVVPAPEETAPKVVDLMAALEASVAAAKARPKKAAG